jgi:FixJ family two-component response regulator
MTTLNSLGDGSAPVVDVLASPNANQGTMRFPIESNPPDPREENAARNGNHSKPICLLDDDPSVLKATGRLLSSAGWRVQAFADPHVFLRHAETEKPRVAIIDILMPLMHGLEVQRRLRDVSPETRVIVLTGKDDKNVAKEALGAGAVGFFLKPLPEDEFLAALELASSS